MAWNPWDEIGWDEIHGTDGMGSMGWDGIKWGLPQELKSSL